MLYARLNGNTVLETTNNIREKFPNRSLPRSLPETIEDWHRVLDVYPDHTIDQKITGFTIDVENGTPIKIYAIENKSSAEIQETKNMIKRQIDSLSEQQRLKYITDGAGQANVYRQKYEEAVAYLAADNPDIDNYPHIKAEIGITGNTANDVCNTVIYQRNTWISISADIEAKRLKAKQDVDNANTISESFEILNNLQNVYSQ